MSTQLEALLVEARVWLDNQDLPAPQSAEWYALNNFRSFLEAIELDKSELSIERAVHALRHHIVDQYDWSADYCKSISDFCNRADRIHREMKWKRLDDN